MPVVTYSLLRLAVFVVALVGLWLAGMGSWLLVVVAAVVAAALSYVLFGKQRAAAAQWLADRRAPGAPRFSRAVEEDAAAEDAIADRLHEQEGPHDERGADPDERGADADEDSAGPDADGEGPDEDQGGTGPAADSEGPGGQIARPSPSSTP